MTTRQFIVFSAALVAAVCVGIIQSRAAWNLRRENQLLKRQKQALAQKIQTLERHPDQTSQGLRPATGRTPDHASRELLQLRGEVTRLRASSNELAQLKAGSGKTDESSEAEMSGWLERLKLLKQRLADAPGMAIPELQLLDEQDWLKAAFDYRKNPKADSDTDFRLAAAEARAIAESAFANRAQQALTDYAKANNGGFPTDPSQLKPFFHLPIDDAILQRYCVVPAKEYRGTTAGQDWVLTQKNLVDEDCDHRINIGAGTWGSGQSVAERLPPDVFTLKQVLNPVIQDFAAANSAKEPADPADLVPYLKTPEQKEAYQKLQDLRNTEKNRANAF